MNSHKKTTCGVIITVVLLFLIGITSNVDASSPGDPYLVVQVAKSYMDQTPGNCKEFVRKVFKEALKIEVPSTSDDMSRWNPSNSFMEVGHVTADNSSLSINFAKLKTLFGNAAYGDAVQMDVHKDASDPNNRSCHSMIFVERKEGEYWFYDSNWASPPDYRVRYHSFSLPRLVEIMGNGGGITIYRPQ